MFVRLEVAGYCDSWEGHGVGGSAEGELVGEILHGVEAFYTNGHMGYQPVFRCTCGFGTDYGCGSWEDAGRQFDEHLEAVKDEIAAADANG